MATPDNENPRPAATGARANFNQCASSNSTVLTPARALTPQQDSILYAIANPDQGIIVVEAGAGCGKSSTIRAAAKQLPTSMKAVYTAFNRSVIEDAKGTMGAVTTRTMHSLAYGPVVPLMKAKGQEGIGSWRVNDLKLALANREHVPILTEYQNVQAIAETVRRFCQSADAEITARHVDRNELALRYAAYCRRTGAAIPAPQIIATAVQPYLDLIVMDAQRLWAKANDPKSLVPVTFDVALKRMQLSGRGIGCDLLFFDEAQDISPVMLGIVQNTVRTGSRLVCVGDPSQSIYGFTGAIDAIPSLKRLPGSIVLPLSVSWRFGSSIAGQANSILSHIDGIPLTGAGPKREDFCPRSQRTILARSNVAIIERAVDLCEQGISAAIPANLAQSCTRDLQGAFEVWKDDKSLHPELFGLDWSALQQVLPLLSPDMQRAVALVTKWKARVPGIIEAVKSMSRNSPDDSERYLLTAHSAKGGEWDQVELADDFRPIRKAEDGEYVDDVECRLAYVAVTRARKALQIGSEGIERLIGMEGRHG